MDKNTEEFYEIKSDWIYTWPALYLFKFIVPTERIM
jgi:hypothetical protein